MKKVFVVVVDYDIEGFRVAGIYDKREDAEAALSKTKDDGYGLENYISEAPLNVYFDIGDINI